MAIASPRVGKSSIGFPKAHYDAAIYPAPQNFDPERFNPDRSDSKPSDYTLVTYGGGARICIGIAFAQMELKIIAAKLIRHYNWQLFTQSKSYPRSDSPHSILAMV